MKSSEELKSMLASEIITYKLKKKAVFDSYNEALGDSSFLLSGILEQKLEGNSGWNESYWIDDSLIHKIVEENEFIHLWGVMIWGRDGTNKQWTDPFYSKMKIDYDNVEITELVILFKDQEDEEITYEDFDCNRSYWDGDYYSDKCWNPSERKWKYIIRDSKTTDC